MKYVVVATLSALAALVATPVAAQTRLITTVSTNTPGGFSGNLSSLNDGAYPANTTPYYSSSVYGFAPTTYFDFAFGKVVNVGAFNLAVDNNDDYTIQFFNGSSLVATRTVSAAQGVVTPTAGGFETFSSSPTFNGTFLSSLSLATPVQATFARIRASGGDGLFAIGEAGFNAAAVPEPATWAMMLLGFGGLGYTMRRRPAAKLRIRFA